MASGEASQPMELQTCMLKVPIHCEGCKKKVKKVISKIPGVHEIAIDSKQNKVTISGNVDADTILKKLMKSNKHVELWPDEKPNVSHKKTVAENSDTKPSSSVSETPASADAGKPEPKEAPKPPEPVAKQAAEPEPVAASSSSSEATGAEPKNENENQPEKPNSSPAPAAAAAKKKSKKPKKVPAPAPAAAAAEEEAAAPRAEAAESSGRARGIGRPMPEHPIYHHQPQPVHAYNMAHPTRSYSHYAPVPAPAIPSYGPQYGYSYNPPPPTQSYNPYTSRHAAPETYYNNQDSFYSPYSAYPPPEASYSHGEPAQPAAESYDLFSDENANSCNVM